jgi:SlyX protein
MNLPVPNPEARRLTSIAPVTDEALEQIQTKIAFLERAAAELSDTVFRQHKEIQALEAKLGAVVDRLSAAQPDEAPRPPEQELPPHY